MTKKMTRIVAFMAIAMLLSAALATQADAGVGQVQISPRTIQHGSYEPIEESLPNQPWYLFLVRLLIQF